MSIPVIDVTAAGDKMPSGRVGYDAVIEAGTASLAPDEYWVIDHDEGALWETASKRLDAPVLMFCTALNCDWDDATGNGFRLARLKKEAADGQL